MLSFIGLLGGAAAKIYDDIEDNNLLQKFQVSKGMLSNQKNKYKTLMILAQNKS